VTEITPVIIIIIIIIIIIRTYLNLTEQDTPQQLSTTGFA
jgi:hypothetical protein